jgi:hypothetical protein
VTDLCVPRPCFFNGQLIGSDDLNAVVTYFRTKETLLARFVGGWGILGGLRAAPAPGVASAPLSALTNTPNPQILAGTVVEISAGAGVDASGRTLALCSPRTVDLTTLVQTPIGPQTQSCSAWFSPVPLPQGGDTSLTAKPYWLIAQFVETPSRPVPQFTGGGPCDPAPSCDFSRRIEDVSLQLVPSLPTSYFLTGCLDSVDLGFNLSDLNLPTPPVVGGPPSSTGSPSSNVGVMTRGPASVGPRRGAQGTLDPCIFSFYAAIDEITAALAGACCSTPALVLGRILFTSSPGALQGTLPNAPVYTILMDGYPFRRVILPAALDAFALASLSCQGSQNQNPPGPGVVVAAGIVGVRGPYPNPTGGYLVVGGLQVANTDPQFPRAAAGRFYIRFSGYVPPSATLTYTVKVTVQQEFAPNNQDPSYVVSLDTFLNDSISLILTQADTLVPPSTLESRYFSIEITKYVNQ